LTWGRSSFELTDTVAVNKSLTAIPESLENQLDHFLHPRNVMFGFSLLDAILKNVAGGTTARDIGAPRMSHHIGISYFNLLQLPMLSDVCQLRGTDADLCQSISVYPLHCVNLWRWHKRRNSAVTQFFRNRGFASKAFHPSGSTRLLLQRHRPRRSFRFRR
jgi:hypothetical protein